MSKLSPVSRFAASFRLACLWLVLTGLACLILLGVHYVDARRQFDADAGDLVRQTAQRVDQHDAHLTSLAAVARFDDPGQAGFLAVSAAVRQYYSRIAQIALVELTPDGSAPRVLAVSGSPPAADAGWSDMMSQASAELGIGKTRLAPGIGPGTFRLIKRIPREPYTVLVFTIDVVRLMAADTGPQPLGWRVDVPDGETTVASIRGVARLQPPVPSPWQLPAMATTARLDSQSQPLVLELSRDTRWADVLPWAGVLVCAVLAALLLGAIRVLQRLQRARREARLQAQALRLANAMHVEGLGEMASGIAHELTQPMTALLSQNQAALRMIEGGAAVDDIAPVIRTNIRLVNRAGAILERMRAYVSRRELPLAPTAVDAVVQGVADLTQTDLLARGIALQCDVPEPVRAVADAVSLEQVLHNLVRNAAEAMTAPEPAESALSANPGAASPRIRLSASRSGDEVRIVVEDNGPGIADDLLPKVFTPFYTTKEGGMGLGLPLCERLMEAMGGSLAVHSVVGQGSRFTLTLKAEKLADAA